MKRKSMIGVLVLTALLLLSTTAFADGIYRSITVLFDNIRVEFNGKEVNFDTEPLAYNNRIYVPIRFVVEEMGGEVFWDSKEKKATLRSYVDFPDCDYLGGEIFVYGQVTDISSEDRTIEIEQHLDDNSVPINYRLYIKEDAVIILQRNDKKINVDFNDLKRGDVLGIVVDKDSEVRGIILTF